MIGKVSTVSPNKKPFHNSMAYFKARSKKQSLIDLPFKQKYAINATNISRIPENLKNDFARILQRLCISWYNPSE